MAKFKIIEKRQLSHQEQRAIKGGGEWDLPCVSNCAEFGLLCKTLKDGSSGGGQTPLPGPCNCLDLQVRPPSCIELFVEG